MFVVRLELYLIVRHNPTQMDLVPRIPLNLGNTAQVLLQQTA
jgi:hypothetical protein